MRDEKVTIITDRFRDIMEVLGLDLSNDSRARTPERVAKMYVQEVFSGLNEANFPDISFFEDVFQHEHKTNMVFIKVGFTSFCEHLFVPMMGFAYVAYLPGEKLIGLSKISWIVRLFARRPQLLGICLVLNGSSGSNGTNVGPKELAHECSNRFSSLHAARDRQWESIASSIRGHSQCNFSKIFENDPLKNLERR